MSRGAKDIIVTLILALPIAALMHVAGRFAQSQSLSYWLGYIAGVALFVALLMFLLRFAPKPNKPLPPVWARFFTGMVMVSLLTLPLVLLFGGPG